MGMASLCSWFPSQPGFSPCCRHRDPGAEGWNSVPCNLCRAGFRMFNGGKEPCLSSSPAAVLPGQEMLFWLPRAHHPG